MRWIITGVTVTLITITVIGVGWVAERNAREALTSEMETRLILEARNLAFLSTDALLSDFPELTLYPVVSEMLEERPDLAFAVVLDHEGTIQGHQDARRLGTRFDRKDVFQPQPSLHPLNEGEVLLGNPDMLVASVPASHANGQVIGSALVGLRRSHLEAMVTRSRQDLVLFLAGLLAAGIASTLVLMSLLLRPIGALREGLERIGRGDLDTPMNLRDRTELGLLARTVNDMASNLKAAREETNAKEQEIVDTQKEVIHTLGEVVESRSRETANHTVRVAEYSYLLACKAGLGEETAQLLRLASPMHDIGKIGIPDGILHKPGKLTPDEFTTMQTHAAIGHNILKESKRRILQAAAVIAFQHHEKWDGSGYPRGLKGEDIHIFGRIVGLVDVFDALTSHRVYKEAMEISKALEIVKAERGRHFDPRLVDLFLANLDGFLRIHEQNPDRAVQPAAAPEPTPEPVVAPALSPEPVPSREPEPERVLG